MKAIRHLSVLLLVLMAAPLAAGETPVVSVFHFDNTSGREEDLWMSRALADGLGSRLAETDLRIVEREDLEAVLKEQRLALSGLTEESDALQLGKILNASQLIRGSYAVLDGRLRVSLKVVDTTLGEVLYSAVREGAVEDYFDIETALALALGDFYGFKPGKSRQSSSREALRLYYKGLLSLDREEYSAAAEDFKHALALDPSYQRPRESLEESYRFLKDFKRARYQREINELYRRLNTLLDRAAADPFVSWGDLLTAQALKGVDIGELSERAQKEPELTWGSTRAEVLWYAQTVMMEISSYAREYFDDQAEALRMEDGVIAVSVRARQEMADDPFLPELIYQELLAWFNRKDWDAMITLCESLMFGWPDYRMMWAIEDFYETALEEKDDPS